MATPAIPQSITEQIFEAMFTELKKSDVFDEQTLAEIENLAATGQIDKHNRVMKVLQATTEENS